MRLRVLAGPSAPTAVASASVGVMPENCGRSGVMRGTSGSFMSVTLEPFGERFVRRCASRRQCDCPGQATAGRAPGTRISGCRGIRCHDGRMPAHVERTELPGIGVRHDIVTDQRRRLSVLNLRDGGRELAIADEDDPDRASETIELSDDEATALSEVLGGSLILTQLAGLRE